MKWPWRDRPLVPAEHGVVIPEELTGWVDTPHGRELLTARLDGTDAEGMLRYVTDVPADAIGLHIDMLPGRAVCEARLIEPGEAP